MDIKRCEKGHFYDAEANSFCPQCAAERAAQAGGGMVDYGATEPMTGMGGMDSYGPTEPMGGFGGADIGATQPVEGGSGFTMDHYEPTSASMGVEDYDSVTTPVSMGGGMVGFTPVVGWLVCTEGAARGTDYRIKAGYNYIGRAEHMDICVRGDNGISREKHAMIAYDQEEKVFFFGPADGKSIVRLNGKMVMTPQEIKEYDILTVSSTKFLFIPLCGERFDWNE